MPLSLVHWSGTVDASTAPCCPYLEVPPLVFAVLVLAGILLPRAAIWVATPPVFAFAVLPGTLLTLLALSLWSARSLDMNSVNLSTRKRCPASGSCKAAK